MIASIVDRRRFVGAGLAGAAALAFAPRMAFAAGETDKRFVFIIQRGAADGLGIVAPVGDPAFAGLRGALAADFADAPRLDGTFALHPALATLHQLYGQRQALFAHAIASPYRDRSHFDGQNVLETGGLQAYQQHDGWMNRMLGVLPPTSARAMAVAATVPMALRGPHEVSSYAPSALPQTSDDLMQRVAMLYQGDPQLHAIWAEAMATRELTGGVTPDNARGAAATGALAARLLRPADGARIAMVETGGWDTHVGQRYRLIAQLRELDALIGALQTGLGPVWQDTMVLVATEFGRTAAINGTGGTDHGTGAVAMLLGGAVAGGRVIGDWPGLATASLYEARDVRPTSGLDAFIGGAVAEHFRIEPGRVMRALFPESAGAAVTDGLVRV